MLTMLFKTFTLMGSEWVLWVLVALSVISLAIILERLKSLRAQERLGAKLWKEQVNDWIAGKTKPNLTASQLAQSYPCIEGQLIDLLANQAALGTKLTTEPVMVSFLSRKRLELEKNLAFLGTVGANAPFIGLFGTVLGIIKAFHDLGGKVESTGAQTISMGLSEALVATAIGLLVAIPAVIAYNYFQRKIKTILGRAESLSNYIMSLK